MEVLLDAFFLLNWVTRGASDDGLNFLSGVVSDVEFGFVSEGAGGVVEA